MDDGRYTRSTGKSSCIVKRPGHLLQSLTGVTLIQRQDREYLEFLTTKGYISELIEDDKIRYVSTSSAAEYIALFSSLYQKVFDSPPEFKL